MNLAAKNAHAAITAALKAGDKRRAEILSIAALAHYPDDANIWLIASLAATAGGDAALAETRLNAAIERRPRWAEARMNRAGLRLQKKDNPGAAEDFAVAASLGFAPAFIGLAQALTNLRDYHRAKDALQRAIAAGDRSPTVKSNLVFLRAMTCDWGAPPIPLAELEPGATLFLTEDAGLQRALAEAFAAKRYTQNLAPRPPLERRASGPVPLRKQRPLRVGYLSSDYHAHATVYLLGELFSLHDRARVTPIALSHGQNDQSPARARIEKTADAFMDLQGLPLPQAIAQMRAAKLDILVDLKGYTRGVEMGLLAARTAPLQMHWLGYPGPLALPFIDYLIADPVIIPDTHLPFYSEAILRLPHTYQINDRERPYPSAPLEEPPWQDKPLVLASFCQTYKITPDMFALWCGLLRDFPAAILWLYESHPDAAVALRAVAAAHGINPARLYFAQGTDLESHLARYHRVDLALDTFPYGGHTTCSDALWMGTPYLTRRGDSFASRVAASLLTALGVPELITDTPEAYAAAARRWLTDTKGRQALREKIKAARQTAPLFDTPAFVRALETLYHQAFARAEAGGAPQTMDANHRDAA